MLVFAAAAGGDAERRAIVTGVRTIVAHAVKMIADVLANPTVMVAQPVQATVETRVIEIPFNKAGLIIGRAGETIRDIMSKSGAHVQVSREATGEDEETLSLAKSVPCETTIDGHIQSWGTKWDVDADVNDVEEDHVYYTFLSNVLRRNLSAHVVPHSLQRLEPTARLVSNPPTDGGLEHGRSRSFPVPSLVASDFIFNI